jgi:FMS-like tyrosine kinase 1
LSSILKVVHADLASRNILLTDAKYVKISDFGLSKKLYQKPEQMHASGEPLPFKWMAPESLKSLAFSTQSDVWSYGVTLWEIFSLAMDPFPEYSYSSEYILQLECGLRLEQPELCPDEM